MQIVLVFLTYELVIVAESTKNAWKGVTIIWTSRVSVVENPNPWITIDANCAWWLGRSSLNKIILIGLFHLRCPPLHWGC